MWKKLLLCLVVLTWGCSPTKPATLERPNILLAAIDDLNGWVGPSAGILLKHHQLLNHRTQHLEDSLAVWLFLNSGIRHETVTHTPNGLEVLRIRRFVLNRAPQPGNEIVNRSCIRIVPNTPNLFE